MKMEELEITIDVLEYDLQDVECKIAKFYEYGGIPGDDEYIKIQELYTKRIKYKANLECLKLVLDAIHHNKGDEK